MLQADQLLADLTEPQRRAVTHGAGPLLVIAAAGSGKTRVITRRVAYLIATGVPPAAILGITFTNKAAGEMKERIGELLGRPLRDFGRLDQPWPTICTFHSLGLRILRHFAPRLGLSPNFTVYDADDQQRMIKEATGTLDLAPENFPPSRMQAAISEAKNQLLTPDAYEATHVNWTEKAIARIYRKYQAVLKENNALDFDDLLMRTAEAFGAHPDILDECRQRFGHILIDEYQDTNHAQYEVAHALAAHGNICVVGDPDQSIYAWRGADIRNILEFEQDYPNATVVRLEQNYRSTRTILRIASELISHNTQRKDKALWTENAAGEPATLLVARNEHDEAMAVAQWLRLQNEQGRPWSDMAVFYRINALSRVLEQALRRENVPYRVARGVDFYHRKEIKDVLAYLRVVQNPRDELSLTRIINVPARGISPATVAQAQHFAAARGLSLWEALGQLDSDPQATAKRRSAVRQFVAMIERWQRLAANLPAPGSAKRIAMLMEDVVQASGLEAHYEKVGGRERSEISNVGELVTDASEFDRASPEGTLADYLAQVSLVSDVDGLKDGGGAVTLLTLHAAKGLEFPAVAMIGMEDGILPHSRVRDEPKQLEEERRLCFVGITRTQQLLLMSLARRRQIRGQTLPTRPSQFLREMPRDAVVVLELDDATEGPPEPPIDMRPGQQVQHPQFGRGVVLDVAGIGGKTRAVIDFAAHGRKNLVVEYSRLEVLG